jgi:ABC-type amino acid transport substrate-binding protein/cytochrome c5
MRFWSLKKALTVSALALASSAGVPPPTSAEDVTNQDLRLCADPGNLPFSSNDPANPGLYLEIGDAIGKALGRPVSHVWYRTYFGKRAVRVTMLAKQCDAIIGLPDSSDFMGPRVIFSKPLFNLGYAIVAPKSQNLGGVEDLKGRRVAVQFETEPQNLLGPREDVTAVTVLSPEEGMEALVEGRVDAAFLWTASAGFLNKTVYSGRFALTPVEGPELSFPTAIGFSKASSELRDSINAVLPEVSKQLPTLLAKYGMAPQAQRTLPDNSAIMEKAAMVVAQAEQAPPGKPAQAAAASDSSADDAAGKFDVAPAMPAPTPDLIAQGKDVFNGTCAHCHGPDAVQGVKKIDLRRLNLRYGDDAANTFWKTVHEGRPEKGMPTWKDVFSDDQFVQIFVFLSSVQSTE